MGISVKQVGCLLRLLILVGLASTAALAAETAKPPSVVLVVVDSLRPDYLGCYGFRGGISPAIDRLCSQAAVFDQAFAQAPWTKASVATLFTSLDPNVHGVLTHRGQFGGAPPQPGVERPDSDLLLDRYVTLAETLQEGGYATAAFVGNPKLQSDFGFAQGFGAYRHFFSANADASAILTAARHWVEQLPAGQPFFVYLHLMDVHAPYAAPESDYEAIRDSPSLGAERTLEPEQLSKDLLRELREVDAHWADPDRPERLQLRTWRGRYAAAVRALDTRLEIFFEFLHASGRDAGTTIVLTSDHGEELFEHGGWGHGTSLMDEQLRVPLIIRPAGGIAGGRRIDGLFNLIDFAPTLAAMVSLKPAPTWKGRSYASLVTGKGKATGQDAIFADGVKWKPSLASIRTRRFKLIRDRVSGQEQLFNLEADPAELRDGRARNGAIASELRSGLESYFKQIQPAPPSPPPSAKPPKANKKKASRHH